jgi:hypothetical protein
LYPSDLLEQSLDKWNFFRGYLTDFYIFLGKKLPEKKQKKHWCPIDWPGALCKCVHG